MKRRDSTISGNSAELQSLKSSDTQVSLQSVGAETPAIDVLIDKFEVPKVGLCCPPMLWRSTAFMIAQQDCICVYCTDAAVHGCTEHYVALCTGLLCMPTCSAWLPGGSRWLEGRSQPSELCLNACT